MPYVAAEDLRNLQSQAAAGVQLRLRLQSQAAEMGTLRVRAAEAAALKQQVQRLAPKAAQASSLKLEIQQLEALLFASNRVSDDCPSGDIVTLVPRPPVFEDLNPGELRTYLRARGLPEDGRKEILVAKLETAFACSAVMASRSKLEAASDSLRQLVVSSVGGRVEWPSADIEAIRLLWQTLLSGDQCLHRRLTGENTTELALELTALADAVGLDAISTCSATYALNDPLNKKGASGAKWVVPLLQAADRHTETADSEVWNKVRTQCSHWLNQCSCSNCSDLAESAGASVRCRMAMCHIERLSHESLMRLLNDLPQERPADCPGAQHVFALLVRQPSSHSASLVAAAPSAALVAAAHSAALVAAAHSAALVFSAHSSARLNSFQLCRKRSSNWRQSWMGNGITGRWSLWKASGKSIICWSNPQRSSQA